MPAITFFTPTTEKFGSSVIGIVHENKPLLGSHRRYKGFTLDHDAVIERRGDTLKIHYTLSTVEEFSALFNKLHSIGYKYYVIQRTDNLYANK